ncbi:uncharacterized protein LOC120008729 [Tripterygium wilfordii]|uniref:uncharacterized protein LOC120008729 n=1 Tax=Tripterygium wilfordii TaxID=458696 RepID=UPI0018F7E6DD|nr:uncharacterized protein LOC120008729 [Tripterygium wilfordii]
MLLHSQEVEVYEGSDSVLTRSRELELHELLNDFEYVFQTPSSLPLERTCDCRITLLLGSKPSSIRPYHYGPIQKTEIEKVVQELSSAGFIRASHSPFSSPVLLVKKKEGTWRMYDILVYSSGWKKHLADLKQTFLILQHHLLLVKEQKCSFGQYQVEYLGNIVSRNGVAANPSKVKAIMEWPLPKNVRDLRGFLGVTGYYRKFVPGYGQICQPLYQKGVENVVANALSRASSAEELPIHEGKLDELRRELEQDEWILAKIQEVKQLEASGTTSKYHCDNGFLKYKSRIVLSSTELHNCKGKHVKILSF